MLGASSPSGFYFVAETCAVPETAGPLLLDVSSNFRM